MNNLLSSVIMFILGIMCLFVAVFILTSFTAIDIRVREGLSAIWALVGIYLVFDFAMNANSMRDPGPEGRQRNRRLELRNKLKHSKRGRR